jgi:hypothetical protein
MLRVCSFLFTSVQPVFIIFILLYHSMLSDYVRPLAISILNTFSLHVPVLLFHSLWMSPFLIQYFSKRLISKIAEMYCSFILFYIGIQMGAGGSVVGWGTILQAGWSRDRFPMRWIFFNLLNLSRRTMALRSTQPLIEMNTRNLPGE